MNWNHIAKAGTAIIMAVAVSAGAHAETKGITAQVVAEKSALGKNDDVSVHLTITNTSSQPQLMLKWHTAFGEIEESLFEITRDGVKVPYLGAHYKRGAPSAADYYLLKPGASHSVKVELSDMYDMSVTGQYAISYSAKSMNLFGTNEKRMGELKSAAAHIWIDGRLAKAIDPPTASKTIDPPSTLATGTLAFNKCTTTQQSQIVSAVSAATNYASNADAYMGGALGARYTKWFGVADAGRIAHVKANYVAIKDAFLNKPITVDCGCKKTYYAYVYPTQPYTIYVCKAFWSAPMTGTDSKGGTLVHEMSHFNVTAGTDDWVYGQTGAAAMAISDPDKATDNADSHEYFGENTPALN